MKNSEIDIKRLQKLSQREIPELRFLEDDSVELAKLYAKTSKGQMQEWLIYAKNDSVNCIWGLVEGKKQESTYQVKPMNIGRQNETSSQEQAILEAVSKWHDQKRKKYFETVEEAQKTVVINPMLAKDYTKRKKFVTWPAYAQPKLDGLRCLAYRVDGKVKLMSRGGKEYILPHISDELENMIDSTQILDGEIYLHGLTLQTINSLVKDVEKDATALKFFTYDFTDLEYLDDSWETRMGVLEAFYEIHHPKTCCFVESKLVNSEKEIDVALGEYLQDGYEGLILRLANGPYKLNGRSSDLLKYKKFTDDEFEIIGWKRGKGKFLNVPSFQCITKDGAIFDCTPKGTEEQRAELLQNADSYIGKMFKVKFFEYSPDGRPLYPVGIAIRLPEDMD